MLYYISFSKNSPGQKVDDNIIAGEFTLRISEILIMIRFFVPIHTWENISLFWKRACYRNNCMAWTVHIALFVLCMHTYFDDLNKVNSSSNIYKK